MFGAWQSALTAAPSSVAHATTRSGVCGPLLGSLQGMSLLLPDVAVVSLSCSAANCLHHQPVVKCHHQLSTVCIISQLTSSWLRPASWHRVWDLETGTCTATLEGHTNEVMTVAISPDGKTAVSGSADATMR